MIRALLIFLFLMACVYWPSLLPITLIIALVVYLLIITDTIQ